MRLCELCLGVYVRVPPAKWKMKANGNSTPVLRIGYHNQRLKGSNDFPFFVPLLFLPRPAHLPFSRGK